MLKNLLSKLLPGVRLSDNQKPSANYQDAANLKDKEKFSPMEIKILGASIELNSDTTTQPFNVSVMDSRTLPSRLKYMKRGK